MSKIKKSTKGKIRPIDLKLKKILSHDKCILLINGVRFTFTKHSEKSIHIERVFVTEKSRGKGFLSQGLKTVTQFADNNKIQLSACFLPDDERHYETLRKVFKKHGFTPEESDGEVYRNDVNRIPKQ